MPVVEDLTYSEDQGHTSDTTCASTVSNEHGLEEKSPAASSKEGEQNSVQDTTQSPTLTAQTSSKGSSEPQEQEDEYQNTDKRGNPAACIFVASLARSKTDEELNVSVSNHFARWGALLNVKVLKDWLHRPYAFVQFERIIDAKKALKEAPGTVLDGRSIRCEPARVNRTICITPFSYPGYLPHETELSDEMSVFGAIESVFVAQHEYCAYIKYRYRDDAIRAFLSLQAQHVPPRWIVNWTANINTIAKTPNCQVRTDPHTVFVNNLFTDVSEDDLYDRFSKYGSIVSVTLIRRPAHGRNHSQRMFAFIKYEATTSAQEAIVNQHGAEWQGKRVRVSIREIREPFMDDRAPPRPSTRSTVIQKGSDHPHPPGMGFPASDIRPGTMPLVTCPPLLQQNSAAAEDDRKGCLDKLSGHDISSGSPVTAASIKKDKHRTAAHTPSQFDLEEPSSPSLGDGRHPTYSAVKTTNSATANTRSRASESNGRSEGDMFVPPVRGGFYGYGPIPAITSAGAYPSMGYYPTHANPQHAFGPLSAYPTFSHRQLQGRAVAPYMNGATYYIPPYSMYSTMPYTAHYASPSHFAANQVAPVGRKCGGDVSNAKGAANDKDGRKHKKMVRS
ncbi:hypothetical protein BX666DRAFT_896184 [Dichotomocladium elegans]|nr:hypothetical protein BX666DRAFT_896184 [Dichotomocladium elegans]